MSRQASSSATTLQYLGRHQVKAALERVLTDLVAAKPDKPFAFLSSAFGALNSLPVPRVIFVLGGPGSGKGTQCARIVGEFDGVVHLSAGDLLREERMKAQSEVGQLIDNYIKEGQIVPVEITVSLLRKAMTLAQVTTGASIFLIDGFPRNQDNLNGWFASVKGHNSSSNDSSSSSSNGATPEAIVDFVLFFDCPESVMESRLLERGKTSGRTDDNRDSIKKRFQTYIDSTMPIIKFFETQNKARKIDATQNVDEVFANVTAVCDAAGIKRKSQSAVAVASSSSSDSAFGGVRPNVLFVLGGPGSGKGTQCGNLVSQFKFVHLSAGDLLRDERTTGNETGQLIETYIKEGKIVPVKITVNLLKNAMAAHISANASSYTSSGRGPLFLIDGFPRNSENLNGWNEVMSDSGATVLGVLFFDCPESVMEARLLERGKTSGRSDDNIDSIRKRFHTYVESTMPIIQHFEAQGKSYKIDATQSVDVVFASVKKIVHDLGF